MAEKSTLLVVCVGDGGIAAQNHIINCGLEGIRFVAVNTYDKGFESSLAGTKLLIGEEVTHGHGAGGRMEMGASAAESSYDDIKAALDGAETVYLIAGLGGGTGTGAAPIIARIAGELGAETTAIVSIPFDYEGHQRADLAKRGVEALNDVAHHVIVVDNNGLARYMPDLAIIENALKVSSCVLAAKVISMLC